MTERKKLIKTLDDLTKDYCRIRDNWICQWCNNPVDKRNAHRSHVIPISHGNRLRWDENNYKLLCYHCHINKWHKSPLQASLWFEKKFPERCLYLETENAKGIKKFTIDELKELIEYYKEKLKETNHD